MISEQRQIHKIDASGKVLGRLATEIAVLLRGKQKPGFAPYKDMVDIVVVKNTKNIKITGNKLEQTQYFRHSGYLGNEKNIPLKKVFKERPGEVLKRAVMGMLPKNKLRARMIKRLKFDI